MVQTQPTLQSVMSMVNMLPYQEQKQLVNQVYYNLSLIEKEPLIDPEWKLQPTRPWSEVYDELCQEVGQAYGLSDIREA